MFLIFVRSADLQLLINALARPICTFILFFYAFMFDYFCMFAKLQAISVRNEGQDRFLKMLNLIIVVKSSSKKKY